MELGNINHFFFPYSIDFAPILQIFANTVGRICKLNPTLRRTSSKYVEILSGLNWDQQILPLLYIK